MMQITKEEIEQVFVKWRKEYISNPDAFTKTEDCNNDDYGINSANEFLNHLSDIRNGN